MIGDKLVLEEKHWYIAQKVTKKILPKIKVSKKRLSIAVSGESGTGKSEIAYVLGKELKRKKIDSKIIGADDFFHLPNGSKYGQSDWFRKKCPTIIGPWEVHLNWMQATINMFKDKISFAYIPLSDRIEEKLKLKKIKFLPQDKIIIAEGTHCGCLDVDYNIFLSATYIDSKDKRLNKRKRSEVKNKKLAKFIEEVVLPKEHKQVLKNKKRANIIISRDFKHIKFNF